MNETTRKFRLGNLIINFAGAKEALPCGGLNSLHPCPLHSQTPNCCAPIHTLCGLLSGCLPHSLCPPHTLCKVGSVPPIEELSPIINELIPQITDPEVLSTLREDLKKALETATKQEEALKPTPEEAQQIVNELDTALREAKELADKKGVKVEKK
jgi:hypothetical protein